MGIGPSCTRPTAVGDEAIAEGFKVTEVADAPMGSATFHSDIHSDQPAHVRGLVHAYEIDELERRYDFTGSKHLGEGTCGSVCTVRSRVTGHTFALKEVTVDGASWKIIRQEIDLQKRLDHPNIAKILESYEDRRHGRIFIVMELCTGGSLVERMKKHSNGLCEDVAATVVEKLMSAVLYCHHHGIVHRDIKLDNVMYEDDREDAEPKLIDFGFAHQVQPGRETMREQLGTPSYMAPELWAEGPTTYDSSVDMWALGVLSFMLLSGRRPFHAKEKREKGRMIRDDPLHFPHKHWHSISEDAKDFCSALMAKVPADRLAASEAVRHPWITTRSRAHSGSNGLDAAHELACHDEIVESLQSFADAEPLQKLALEVIAFSTPPGKMEDLRSVFQKMDSDDSGTLSLHEFKDAMSASRATHPEVNSTRIEEMFNTIDLSHSGEVDYTEFLAATVSSQRHISTKSINTAWMMLDDDADGFITRRDLENALEGSLGEKTLGAVMVSSDNDGRISYETFKEMLRRGLQAMTPSPVHMPRRAKLAHAPHKSWSTSTSATAPAPAPECYNASV